MNQIENINFSQNPPKVHKQFTGYKFNRLSKCLAFTSALYLLSSHTYTQVTTLLLYYNQNAFAATTKAMWKTEPDPGNAYLFYQEFVYSN